MKKERSRLLFSELLALNFILMLIDISGRLDIYYYHRSINRPTDRPKAIMCTVLPPARNQNEEKENLAPEYLPPSFKSVLSSDDESCSSTSSGIGSLSTASSYALEDPKLSEDFEMDKTYQTECKDHVKSISKPG